MNSVLSVSLFVSSIFFSESALKTFLIFCINLGDNMGLKRTFTKFFKYFGIFPKTTQRIFLIFCQNVELNSVFQPVKTVCEKKNLFRSYFRSKMHRGSLLNDLYILHLAEKCLDLAETFRK